MIMEMALLHFHSSFCLSVMIGSCHFHTSMGHAFSSTPCTTSGPCPTSSGCIPITELAFIALTSLSVLILYQSTETWPWPNQIERDCL